MSEVGELVRKVESLGATLTLYGELLELDVPVDFPDDLMEALRQRKPEVIAHKTRGTDRPLAQGIPALLAWASELAEQDLTLTEPVSYLEATLCTISTQRVSWYASHYLRGITSGRIGQHTGGWGIFDAEWHREQETEALAALAALRKAMVVSKVMGQGNDLLH